MALDIISLRYAVLAADTRSFARAASTVGVKQTTLSRRISALERRIGLALSSRCVVWDLAEVEAWLASRRAHPIHRGQQVDVRYRRTRPVKG